MFLICGLGNPGKKYLKTRHNIGFVLIEKLISNYNFVTVKKDKKKELYKGYIGRQKCILIKPLAFMNLSGSVILEALNLYKIKNSNLYVIHDDLDLKLAKIKIKIGGGNGGHNGLESIDSYIGKKYHRIRIGIDHPGNKNLVTSYVLSKFSKIEEILIHAKLDIITKYFKLIFTNNSLFLTRISEEEQLNGF